MRLKRCSNCFETKPVSEFYVCRTKKNYQSRCKACNNEVVRGYYHRKKLRDKINRRRLINEKEKHTHHITNKVQQKKNQYVEENCIWLRYDNAEGGSNGARISSGSIDKERSDETGNDTVLPCGQHVTALHGRDVK